MKRDFDAARALAAVHPRAESGIGSLSEGSLHHLLKFYFEPDADRHEVGVGRYFADILNEDGIIEIQTRALYRLSPKLDAFLPLYPVTVVYPVASVKRVSWIDPKTGEKSRPRRSPKKGTKYDCVRELYALRKYLSRPGFRFCIVYLEIEELRLKNGWGNGGKKGSSRADRIPLSLCDIEFYNEKSDYAAFIPPALESPFTVERFSAAAKTGRMAAGMSVKLLELTGNVRLCGSSGRAKLYETI